MLSRLRYIGKSIQGILSTRGMMTLGKKMQQSVGFRRPGAFPQMLSACRMFSDLPSHTVLNLPNLSPTMTKGTITKWYKKEGDSFEAGDVLCDVETDKATVGFEMVDSGVLAKIIMPEGSKDVPLGAPVAVTVENEGDVAAFKDFKAEAKPAAAKAPEAPKEKAEPKKEEPKKEEPKKAEPKKEITIVEGQYPIMPSARRLAVENGIDLSLIKGTGMGGRIMKEDILDYLENPNKIAKKPEAAAGAPAAKKIVEIPGMPPFEDIEVNNIKRVTAERLTEAKQTVPHFYVTVECEVDKLLSLRQELNKISTSKISINDMLIKAASLACMKVPAANSAFMGTFVRQYKDVDMCVAVQTPNGLIAPIVPRANLLGFEKIAKATKDIIDKARENKLKPEEFIGGTFTISNAGMFGIDQLISIVNPPQACILGVSRVTKKFKFDSAKKEGEKPWRIVSRMNVSLSCDHRVVDGAVASTWTQEFKKLVENPMLMLL